MNELPKTKTAKLYWWSIILYFALFSFNALATSTLGALVGAKWDAMSAQEKFLIFMAILANWTGLVIVFIQKSMARLVSGRPPIETGETKHLSREEAD